MGLLLKISSIHHDDSAAKGLLKRSIETFEVVIPPEKKSLLTIAANLLHEGTDSSPIAEPGTVAEINLPAAEVEDDALAKELEKRLASLHGSLDTPVHIFIILKELLKFPRGVLLLFDSQHQVWTPCAAAGRITAREDGQSDIPEISSLPDASGECIELPQEDVEGLGFWKDDPPEVVSLKQYREKEDPIATLMMEIKASDIHLELLGRPGIEKLLTNSCRILAQINRTKIEGPSSLEKEIESLSPPNIYRISFGSISEEMCEDIPFVHRRWAENMIMKALGFLTAGLGSVYSTGPGTLSLIPHSESEIDPQLLDHHIHLALDQLLQQPDRTFSVIAENGDRRSVT